MIASASRVRAPRRFDRSNTTVSNDEVVVGERHFRMSDVLGAQVWDITAGKHLVEPERRKAFMVWGFWLMVLGVLGFVVALLPGDFLPARQQIQWILYVAGITGYLLTIRVTPGYRPYFKKHEYYLTLNMRKGPEDVITGFDPGYLEDIAKEINIRSTGNASLPRQST